jgi:hypothetical protein
MKEILTGTMDANLLKVLVNRLSNVHQIRIAVVEFASRPVLHLKKIVNPLKFAPMVSA